MTESCRTTGDAELGADLRTRVGHQHGEWFKVVYRQGVPYHKAGPWECCHQNRACFWMLRRLD